MGVQVDHTHGRRRTRITRAAREAVVEFNAALDRNMPGDEYDECHNLVDPEHPFWKWEFPQLGYVVILEVDRDNNPSNLLVRSRYIQKQRPGHRELPLRDPIKERYVFSAHHLGGEFTTDIPTLVRIVMGALNEVVEAANIARNAGHTSA